MYLYLLLFLLPAVAIVIVTIVLEIRCYFRCQFYKKQGLPVFYTMFIDGVLDRFMKGVGTKNQIEPLQQDYKAVKELGKPAYVLTNFRRSCANVIIIEPALMREFFIKESEVCKREMLVDFKMPMGFLIETGNVGLDHRAIFSEYFKV